MTQFISKTPTWREAILQRSFDTDIDKAVFWSGYLHGNKDTAAKYADKRGKNVLENTDGGKWLKTSMLTTQLVTWLLM